MDTIAFIQNDVEKDARLSGGQLAVFALATAALPSVLGVFLRHDLNGVFSAAHLVPNLIAAALFAAFPVLYRNRTRAGSRRFSQIAVVLAFATLFAIARLAFPDGARTGYVSSEAFWIAARNCFGEGLIGGGVTGLWLGFLAIHFYSLPSRRWRVIVAAAGGVASAVLLGFHCDSSSVAHVVVGHLFSGVASGAVIYAVLTAAFHRQVGAARKI